MSRLGLILLAGGIGSRMKSKTPKQFLQLGKKCVAMHSLDLFSHSGLFEEIVIVCAKPYRHYFQNFKGRFAEPGSRRQDSVASGEKLLSPQIDAVVIHDAARPFITLGSLQTLLEKGTKVGAATLGLPIKWTVKECETGGLVKRTLDRSNIWEIQTPQFLRRDLVKEGLKKADQEQLTVTDDVSLAELLGHPVQLVEGPDHNIKITTPIDMHIATRVIELG
jgi:2-C-methyl-D-erythritol 4-phosphate cytidylyltransferase